MSTLPRNAEANLLDRAARHVWSPGCAAAPVGKRPIVTDALEATRQHVQQESAHELAGFQRHGLVAGAPPGAAILPMKVTPVHRTR
jgi:hypothetical protein